ncbi:MAG: hypothetical protein GC191_12010 [Azospirillum sp.]|nr:hypothetical protein [Azospirillum sp.]
MTDKRDPVDGLHKLISTEQKRVSTDRHVWGTSHDDRLEGGRGNDRIYAGRGDDTVLFTWDSGHDVFFGESGTNALHLYGKGMARASFTIEVKSGAMTEQADCILLDPGTVATVTLTDGSSIELHQTTRITWSVERQPAADRPAG